MFAYSHPTNGGSVRFVVGKLLVDQGGQLSADGGGYTGGNSIHQNGYGPGFGYRGANSGGGAGYGGTGGLGGHATSYPGITYGSASFPLQPGSGGGDYRGTPNGPGGGLIWVEASDQINLAGKITANAPSPSGYQGAGSGGGIYLAAKRMYGTASGQLSANGANGGSESGGGGGGRIAVWSMYLLWPFTNNVSVTNGLAANPPTSSNGTPGTVFYGQIPIPKGTTITIR